jgi:tRNA(Ile)-lysidine synthase
MSSVTMLPLPDPLLDGVAELMTRYSIASEGDRVAVAVSGGADSVVLLHVLHRLAPQFRMELLVIHVDHQLRGAESDADRQFVQEVAFALGLELIIERAPVRDQDGNLEQAARDGRRRVFHSLIESGRAKCVATGHTRSDQAETVLFRLLRGSGVTGLAGMRVVTKDGIVRPLLRLSREHVRNWATAQGLSWREDSSNADSRFNRNLLRNELLPVIKGSINAGVEGVLAGTAEVAQAEEDYWQDLIEHHFQRLAKRSHHGLLCDIDYWRKQPLAVRRRLLRRSIFEVKGNLRSVDSAHVDAIAEICESNQAHDRVMIPGVDALRSFSTLRLVKPAEPGGQGRHYQVRLPLGREIQLPFRAGAICIDLLTQELPANGVNCVNFKDRQDLVETARLGIDAIGGFPALERLVIRNWEPGDGFQRVGHASREKLKTLFQESRVLLWERKHWPVLELDGEILWVRRFGAAAHVAAEPNCVPAVSIRYKANLESEVQFLTSY